MAGSSSSLSSLVKFTAILLMSRFCELVSQEIVHQDLDFILYESSSFLILKKMRAIIFGHQGSSHRCSSVLIANNLGLQINFAKKNNSFITFKI